MRLFITPTAIFIGLLLNYFIVNPFYLVKALVVGIAGYVHFVIDTLYKWTCNYLSSKFSR